MDDNRFIAIKEMSELDVLDECLYNFDNEIFTIVPSIQKETSDSLYLKIKEFFDSLPAVQKAMDNVQEKTEYIPRFDLLSDEIKQALKNGTVEMIPGKDTAENFLLQIRTTVKDLVINGTVYGKNRKIKDVFLNTQNIPKDVSGAMQCLATQNQFNQLTYRIQELSEACKYNFNRMIQGQRDDRLAKLLSSRSSFIQAITVSDEGLKKQLLIQAIRDANTARAELAYQIKSDIILLGNDKTSKEDARDSVLNINVALVAMNNAVQLSLYSFQSLGERQAQLAVAKEHQTFIKQVLLKEIAYKGKMHPAWDVICSNAESGTTTQDFIILPVKLIDNCNIFIEDSNKNLNNFKEGE